MQFWPTQPSSLTKLLQEHTLGGEWVAKDVLTTIARALGFTVEFFLDHVDENGGVVREVARWKCCEGGGTA
jgi:hypothetical protein